MGVSGPRTPAVHRGARIVDAIASGNADTPTALTGTLGLAKSSLADLVGALEDANLVGRSPDGRLHTGPRWAAWSDPDAAVDRLFRACARTPDLDGHTVSVVRLFGDHVICVDVRPGRHPLPLTPRPGQRTRSTDAAGAIAILSELPIATVAETVHAVAAHLGLSDEQIAHTLALRRRQRSGLYTTHSAHIGRQFACVVAGTQLALTLHLPERWPDSASVRKATKALATAAGAADRGPCALT